MRLKLGGDWMRNVNVNYSTSYFKFFLKKISAPHLPSLLNAKTVVGIESY